MKESFYYLYYILYYLHYKLLLFPQALQMRLGQVVGFDMQQANRWQWRPDYEGINLSKCR